MITATQSLLALFDRYFSNRSVANLTLLYDELRTRRAEGTLNVPIARKEVHEIEQGRIETSTDQQRAKMFEMVRHFAWSADSLGSPDPKGVLLVMGIPISLLNRGSSVFLPALDRPEVDELLHGSGAIGQEASVYAVGAPLLAKHLIDARWYKGSRALYDQIFDKPGSPEVDTLTHIPGWTMNVSDQGDLVIIPIAVQTPHPELLSCDDGRSNNHPNALQRRGYQRVIRYKVSRLIRPYCDHAIAKGVFPISTAVYMGGMSLNRKRLNVTIQGFRAMGCTDVRIVHARNSDDSQSLVFKNGAKKLGAMPVLPVAEHLDDHRRMMGDVLADMSSRLEFTVVD